MLLCPATLFESSPDNLESFQFCEMILGSSVHLQYSIHVVSSGLIPFVMENIIRWNLCLPCLARHWEMFLFFKCLIQIMCRLMQNTSCTITSTYSYLWVHSHVNLLSIESESPSFVFKLHLWERALWMLFFGCRMIFKEHVSLFKTYRLHC